MKKKPKNKEHVNCRIAIPLENGNLCSHFGDCKKFAIFHVNGGVIADTEYHSAPEHRPGAYPLWLTQFDITDVISGDMGMRAIRIFQENKINVFTGAPIKPVNELAQKFIEGNLELASNACDHDHHHKHGHRHKHGHHENETSP